MVMTVIQLLFQVTLIVGRESRQAFAKAFAFLQFNTAHPFASQKPDDKRRRVGKLV